MEWTGRRIIPSPSSNAITEETLYITTLCSSIRLLPIFVFPKLCSILYHTAYCVELPSEDGAVKQSTVQKDFMASGKSEINHSILLLGNFCEMRNPNISVRPLGKGKKNT